jgi:serine/threonine protein kinase, bacterial
MTQPCPHCNAANRDTAQFCAQCSQPLRQICASCGADNPPRSRFCNKCGAPLAQWLHCPQCDRVNPAGSLFCNGCGATLSPEEQQPSAPASPVRYAGTGHLAPQTRLAGRYVILCRVGRGGMGAVYQAADDRITGKMWAIKEMSDAAIIDPQEKQQALDGFRQEAVMLATLDHPNLPKVTDHFSEGGKQYLVMDFIEGETLEERVDREVGKPLPVDEVLGWADQLCDVLAYLHRREPPVIFRDLKPGNVMVTPDGRIKLIDFGIARLFKPGKAADTAFFGTSGYSPREQYGRGQTDARSDVYALGATLYHLLTGDDPTDHPFDFKDVHSLNEQVPEHVAGVIAKALAHDSADRWQSVREMQQALAERPLPRPRSTPEPESEPKPGATVSVPAQPAMAVAKTAATTAQPASMPIASHLNFWRGLGLVLLGAGLPILEVLISRWLRDEFDFPWRSSVFAFVGPLFGVLFGPWVGGLAGALGWSLAFGLGEFPADLIPLVVVAGFVMGAVPAWLVRDARNWRLVIGVGFVASLLWAVIFPLGIGILYGEWSIALENFAHQFFLMFPANVTFLPFLAQRLVGVRDRGVTFGIGVGVTLLWAVLATAEEFAFVSIVYREPFMWYADFFGKSVLMVLPVGIVLVLLVAFWLAGSVRRWGLYWRDYQ